MIPYRQVTGILIGTILILLLSLFASCSDRNAPPETTVRDLLASFYSQQGYNVVSLELGGTEGAPLAQKSYGIKRAYYVTVKSLTLEGNGPALTLQNGVVTFREKRGEPGQWDIERVPPELIPK